MNIDKSWYVETKGIPIRLNAGGVVVRKEKDKLLAGLIRDTNFEDYTIPKGGVEKGEDVLTAAKREIGEETGITDLKLITKLGIKRRLTYEKNFWGITHYFLFTTDQIEGEQRLERDEGDIIFEWFDVENLPKFVWPEQEKIVKENLGKIKAAV